jgi:hypothetical protein
MFNLTTAELDAAFVAINHHGYSAMLPDPPEWSIIAGHWPAVRAVLEKIDLDVYEPFRAMKVFAPKSRASIRVLHMLHPQDLVIYTALVLIARDDIEANRVPVRERRVYSFRADPAKPQVLYKAKGSHEAYRKQLHAKTDRTRVKFVALADIADFYPRIYQHRLENVIEAVATNQRVRDVARVLVRKLISNLMERNSYGIPVGPYASRVLAESVLIDVDAILQTQQVDFVRWVDDYNIFCTTEHEAQSVLFSLGEWLFSNHGLTLQSAKTKILTKDHYKRQILASHEGSLTNRDAVVKMLREFRVGYENREEETPPKTDQEVAAALAELQSTDLLGMLDEALEDTALVDYEAVAYVLTTLPRIPGAPAELKREVLKLSIKHAEALYPVAEHLAKYVLSFDDLTRSEQKQIARNLLNPLKSKRSPPPAYYAMWILHIFASAPEWNHARDIVSLYAGSTSEVIGRHAALAIHSSGNRSEAVAIKDDYVAASPVFGWPFSSPVVSLATMSASTGNLQTM